MVVWENASDVAVQLSTRILELFDEYRVFCDHQYNNGPRRWKVGDVISFRKDLITEPYVGFLGGNELFAIGSYSYTHSNLGRSFTLGRYCSIAGNVRESGWQHPTSAVSTSLATCNPEPAITRWAFQDQGIENMNMVPTPQKPSPILGNDVWVGSDVILMKGIRIGDGAIVATGSVVSKDVEPYAIVGGAPAKFIRWRHSPEVREALSAIEWWRYKLSDLKVMDFANPSIFVKQISERYTYLEPWSPQLLNIWSAIRGL